MATTRGLDDATMCRCDGIMNHTTRSFIRVYLSALALAEVDSWSNPKEKAPRGFHVSAPVLAISLVFWVEVLAARRAVSQAALGSKEISYPGDPLIF